MFFLILKVSRKQIENVIHKNSVILSNFHSLFRSISSLGHSEDVGIECHTLRPTHVASKLYWDGIEFVNEQAAKLSQIEHVDVVKAFIGIKSTAASPELRNVPVKETIIGAPLEILENPLTKAKSLFTGNLTTGIEISGITSGNVSINIRDTTISNTTIGDGMKLKRASEGPSDFCSLFESSVSFPINLQAIGKPRTCLECLKVVSSIASK